MIAVLLYVLPETNLVDTPQLHPHRSKHALLQPVPRGASVYRISLMVAFWPKLQPTPGEGPGAGRPFPYPQDFSCMAERNRDLGSKVGMARDIPSWTALFDWPESEDGEAARMSGGSSLGPRPAPLEPISPVWQRIAAKDGTHGDGAQRVNRMQESAPISIPAYEACFQGF